jgi:hypothetical protein
MLPLAAIATTKAESNYWLGSVYAGLATAIIAVATCLTFQAELPILFIPAFLLIGIGPVLGYQFATGTLGSDWKPLIGGILGFILAPVAFIVWPLLVGALDKTQSVGKLFLGSIIGAVLGIAVFLIMLTLIGQNPYTIGLSFTMLMAVWGGSVGAAMIAWSVE